MHSDRDLGALSDVAPDFVALLTPQERPIVERYWAKIQAAPQRYESMMTPGPHHDLHFVRLSYTLAWYSMARRTFFPPLVAMFLIGLPGAILGGAWLLLLLPGLAIVIVVGFGRFPRLAGRLQTVRAFFDDRLGSFDPGSKRMM